MNRSIFFTVVTLVLAVTSAAWAGPTCVFTFEIEVDGDSGITIDGVDLDDGTKISWTVSWEADGRGGSEDFKGNNTIDGTGGVNLAPPTGTTRFVDNSTNTSAFTLQNSGSSDKIELNGDDFSISSGITSNISGFTLLELNLVSDGEDFFESGSNTFDEYSADLKQNLPGFDFDNDTSTNEFKLQFNSGQTLIGRVTGATAVPEPSHYALLSALALVAICVGARRRLAKSS